MILPRQQGLTWGTRKIHPSSINPARMILVVTVKCKIVSAIRTSHHPNRYRPLALVLILFAAAPLVFGLSSRQVETWRRQIRKALYIPTPLPSLAVRNLGSFSPVPGVTVERVTYASEYGLRIPALLYRPTHADKKLPGIVIVSGHGGDKSSWYDYYSGVLFAKAGAAVLTYDPVGSGERNDKHKYGAGEHDQLISVPSLPQRMGGLMISDVMQSVAYLRQRPDVDPSRVAVLGWSLGSFDTALTGAVDPHIHSILLTGGGDLDGHGGYWDSSHLVMCQSGPYTALLFLGDRPAVLYTLNAQRGTTFIINGTADTVVDIPHHEADFFHQLRARTIALNGSGKNVFQTYFVPGASHRPDWLMLVSIEWLDRQLHFTHWKTSRLASLPTISIGDWAKKNDVHLSKAARRENRAAGIVTIDAGVPKMTEEQVNVLPMNTWRELRQDFVYSSWVRDAVAAAEAPQCACKPSAAVDSK